MSWLVVRRIYRYMVSYHIHRHIISNVIIAIKFTFTLSSYLLYKTQLTRVQMTEHLTHLAYIILLNYPGAEIDALRKSTFYVYRIALQMPLKQSKIHVIVSHNLCKF